MKVIVNKVGYKWSHGREPKGEGFWAFNLKPRMVKEKRFDECIDFAMTGKYGDAVKAAKAKAKEFGADTVLVLP